jgi:energy-coupling factor transporter ATP-binding protein EcfA2
MKPLLAGKPEPDVDKLRSNIVYLTDVLVDFDGFKALQIKEFTVHFNELRVVIGPNGAGKTTLCDVISGKTRVTDGHVYFNLRETTASFETSGRAKPPNNGTASWPCSSASTSPTRRTGGPGTCPTGSDSGWKSRCSSSPAPGSCSWTNLQRA